MIKNASSGQRISLHSLLGDEISADALDLVNQLLVFNPMKRLTAEEALEHQYVSRFHDPAEEIEMNSSIVIPLNDDVRLAVDDYRNKLYEIMSNHVSSKKISSVKPSKSDNGRLESKNRLYTEHLFKSRPPHPKDKPYFTYSEPKLCQMQQRLKHTTAPNMKSDAKVSKQFIVFPEGNVNGKSSSHSSSSFQPREYKGLKKKPVNSKNNMYMSFNSYHSTHGIITQSALMELRAAGTR